MMMPTKKHKIKYRSFSSSEQMNWFFKRNINPVVKDKVEYCVMEKFRSNRLLFTAEHGIVKRLEFKGKGTSYVIVGDRNTDIMAKLGSYHSRSAYITPLFVRTEADASRDPRELGKGLRLFVRMHRGNKEIVTYIPIHANPSYLPYLENYNNLIEKLNPKFLISVHGMGSKRKFDVLFGFGTNYESVGGKKEAFKFKNEFTNYLDRVFSELGIRANLKIAVSTWRFTGSKNYILTEHVIKHNKRKSAEENRYGLQAEFNWRGRVSKAAGIPSPKYQILIQALGDFVRRWVLDNK